MPRLSLEELENLVTRIEKQEIGRKELEKLKK